MPHEISCLNINPVGVEGSKAKMCAVGLWTDISVKILALPGFEEIRSVPIEGEVIPRSVLFYTFDDITYLFIALGDGHLISYVYDLVCRFLDFLLRFMNQKSETDFVER